MLFELQYIELIIRFTLARIFVTKRAAYLAVYGIRLSTGGLLLVSFFSEQNLNVESVSECRVCKCPKSPFEPTVI